MAGKRPGKSRAKPEVVAEDNPAGSVIVEEAADAALESLANTLAALHDPTGYEVLLYELDDRGSRSVLTRIAPVDFDPFTVAEEFGAGTYYAQVRETGGGRHIKTQAKFTVAAHIRGKRRQAAQTPAAPTDKTDVMTVLLTMMQASQQQAQAAMAQQTQLVGAILSRPNDLAAILPAILQAPKPTSDITQLVGALGALDQLRGDAAPPAAAGESEYAWMAGPLTVLLQGMMTKQAAEQQQQQQPAQVHRRPPTTPHTPPSVRREPATAVLSSAVAGDADQAETPTEPADQAAAILEQVRAAVIARIVLGRPIEPKRIAAELDAALDPDALDEWLASLAPGQLPAQLLAGVPPELSQMVTANAALMRAIAQIQTELSALIAQAEQAADDTNEPAEQPEAGA